MNRRLVIMVFISALVIVGLVISLRKVFKKENITDECITSGCIKAAAGILKDIDPRINPCDNFYDFACGGYLSSNQIPHTADSISHIAELTDEIKNQLKTILEEPISPDERRLFKFVKTLYWSCINITDTKEVDLESLRQTVEEYGKWPVLEGDKWKEEEFDWTKSVHTSRKLGYSINNFITLQVTVDWTDTTKYILALRKATSALPKKLVVDGTENDQVQAYFKLMVGIAVLFGANEHRATQELEESLKFEIALANITDRYVYQTSIAELEERHPFVNWTEYINNLLPQNSQVDADEVVAVVGTDFISILEKILTNTSKRVQANYAVWRVVREALEFSSKNESERQNEYVSATSENITTDSDHRWKECVGNITESSLSIITNALYVRKYFKEDTRQKAIEMVTDIKQEMTEILKEADWMDNETKYFAIEKIKYILDLVGYPLELLDDQKLEEFYFDLKLSPDDFLGNVLNSNKIFLNYSLGLLRKSVNKREWVRHDLSTQINAFYSPTENSINIPAGILQGTFFEGDRPRYMNYGAIGYVIGHEISHSFDPRGRRFDKDGNFMDWWTSETEEKYSQKTQCFINQYSNYTVESIGLKVDGDNTLAENVADNCGIKAAYLAYKEYIKRNGPEPKLPGLKYTPEQMFWISTANPYCSKYKPQEEKLIIKTDVHSHRRFRVIGTLANSLEFSADFNCPMGSYMNPVHKCSML